MMAALADLARSVFREDFHRPSGDWAETAWDNGFTPIPMKGKRPLLNICKGYARLERRCDQEPDD